MVVSNVRVACMLECISIYRFIGPLRLNNHMCNLTWGESPWHHEMDTYMCMCTYVEPVSGTVMGKPTCAFWIGFDSSWNFGM